MTTRNHSAEIAQYTSRKWYLAILVVILATVGAFVPPLVSAWLFGADKPLVVLSGAEWVSVITLVTGLYIGGNVWQKHVENRTKRHLASLDPLHSGVDGGDDEEKKEDEIKDEDDDSDKEA
jgi:hypothetical protein